MSTNTQELHIHGKRQKIYINRFNRYSPFARVGIAVNYTTAIPIYQMIIHGQSCCMGIITAHNTANETPELKLHIVQSCSQICDFWF